MRKTVLPELKRINLLLEKKRERNFSVDKSLNFQDVLLAAMFRSLDYCLEINKKRKAPKDSIFLMSGLRAICEDLIFMVELSKWSTVDSGKYCELMLTQQCIKSVSAQHNFFQVEKPCQIYVRPTQNDGSSELRDMKQLWQKYGFIFRHNSPTVFAVAEKNKLEPLYRYLYHASSESVHHSVRFLLRMGWGEFTNKKKTIIKTKLYASNYCEYYFDFCKFYSLYLMVKYYKHLASKMKIKAKISEDIHKIEVYLNRTLRWPELVTFEELNLKPPSTMVRIIHEMAISSTEA